MNGKIRGYKPSFLVAALLALMGATSQGQPSSALHEMSVDQAVAVATTLGTQRSSKAVSTLLDALAMGVHPKVAAACLDALSKNAKPSAYETVAFYLHHRNPQLRAKALRTIAVLPDKRVLDHLLNGLHDSDKTVRATAAELLAAKNHKAAIQPLLALLTKGDKAAAMALASMATPELARLVAEQIGSSPDGVLTLCLGAILLRPDFRPEDARVEVVNALGKIPGNDALEQLSNYIDAIPPKPPRQSRKRAEAIVEARLGGE